MPEEMQVASGRPETRDVTDTQKSGNIDLYTPTSFRNPHLNRASASVGHNLIFQRYLFTLGNG
jgi:hypothetical protein